MKQMLALPVTDCPPPAKTYDCPICQATLGRKALTAHLRREHQAERPTHFPSQADRDMLPGQLARSHHGFCIAHTLQTSCPVSSRGQPVPPSFGRLGPCLHSCVVRAIDPDLCSLM